MVAPQRAENLEEWVDFAEKLSPVENLALVGLLFLSPNRPPLSISPSVLHTEENLSNAEKWAITNFRKGFSFYCENYKKHRGAILSEAVKRLAPALVALYSWSLGLSVGFIVWAIKYGLDNSCDKYGARKFNGKGKYITDRPGIEFEGFFDLTYFPAITEVVQDPESYPLEGYKVILKAPAETTGLIKVSSAEEVNDITLTFKGQDSHSFRFTDTRSGEDVEGYPERVFPERDEGPNIVKFTGSELVVT